MDIDRGWGRRGRVVGFSTGGLNIVTSLDLLNVSVHESSTWLLDRDTASLSPEVGEKASKFIGEQNI
jgi:hypothetical protein